MPPRRAANNGVFCTTPPKTGRRQKRPPPAVRRLQRKNFLRRRELRNLGYRSVEDLQTDVLAYQNGFATSAEKAGAWRQIALLVRRHKATALGLAAVLLTGATLGTQAVVEGRRAERANLALRRQAPALRQLAESEAGFQRFDSALEKLDAALALDPAHLPGYWRRAWLFIGMDRLPEAAAALRLAQQKDPAHAELAAILPTVEKLAAIPSGERWPVESAGQLWDYLMKVGASGETLALSAKLKLSAKDKQKLVRQRLDEWLGKNQGGCEITPDGLVQVNLGRQPIDTIEPLRGLPIESLNVRETKISSVDSIKGMPLVKLHISGTRVSDPKALRGLGLRELGIGSLKIETGADLAGTHLQTLDCQGCDELRDLSALRNAPLRKLVAGYCHRLSDISFLASAPIEILWIDQTEVRTLSVLKDKPLRDLSVDRTPVDDLSPLRKAPIETLVISGTRIKDLTPLLDLPKLKKLRVSKLGKLLEPLRDDPTQESIAYDDEFYRPVKEFWDDYDAPQAAGKK